jgi:ATP-dependent Lon protease
LIAILTQKDSIVENPNFSDLHEIGTVAKIMRTIDMPDGSKTILMRLTTSFLMLSKENNLGLFRLRQQLQTAT